MSDSDYFVPPIVKPTPGGAAGAGSLDGPLTVQADTVSTTANNKFLIVGSDGAELFGTNASGECTIYQNWLVNNQFSWVSIFPIYNNINTVANGVPAFRGIDDRTSVTAVDSAEITVYAVPATTGKFRVSATLYGRSGTITAGTYVIKYTIGGFTVTKTMTISAVNTDVEFSLIIHPDASTNVTAQLTALTGTSPSVDVTCLVEGIGSDT